MRRRLKQLQILTPEATLEDLVEDLRDLASAVVSVREEDLSDKEASFNLDLVNQDLANQALASQALASQDLVNQDSSSQD